MDVSDILDGLNPAQREAVAATPGPILVQAGAGSGKTRVLTHRIAWLNAVEGVSPFSVLAVTFTNKAASEMRARVEAMLGMPVGPMWIGTFHGLAHRLLRQHWREAKLQQGFQILDADDQLRVVKRVVRGLELDEARWPPKQAVWWINARKDEGLRAKHLLDDNDPVRAQYIRIYTAYENVCEQNSAVDFAELLLRALELIRDNPELLTHYQRRFQHILVDEFQDTNAIQYAWLRLLAGERGNVFAVGDDDQSIYSWRGARVENILNFQKDFSGTQLIQLEQNYRSTNKILSAANALIANNVERIGKNLWTADEGGDPITLYTAYNETDEARFICERISHNVEGGGRRDECAVLYRSNAQSRVIESALLDARIPYRVYGGQRFFERAEIKDALAYLRLLANENDDVSFERVVNHPPRGIGDKTVSQIRDAARMAQVSLWTAAEQLLSGDVLSGRAANAVRGFLELIRDMRDACHELPLQEVIVHCVETSTLKEYFERDNSEKGQSRVENLEELASVTVARTDSINQAQEMPDDMSELDQFLANAALDAGDAQGQAWEDCVQLMTLHSAKGLEFPIVFLTGMEEGLFPGQRSIEDDGRMQEERRLCYVGITRAEKQLYLTLAEQRRLYGQEHYSMASRFIGEIPAELVEDVRPRVFGSRPSYDRAHSNLFADEPAPDGISVGQRVAHAKFGEGTVTDFEGHGSHARVQVQFSDVGSKWLVLAYAKLAVI
ncbi:MAG: DNA helicase II [Pseudomonadota bacterium]